MTSIVLYAALEQHADGEWSVGDLGTYTDLDALIDDLVAGEDDERTQHVFEIRVLAPMQSTSAPITHLVAEKLAARYRDMDDLEDGLPRDERVPVHPLAVQAGFEWTLNEWEIEEIGADYALQQAKEDAL